MVTLSTCLIWQIISFILPPNEYGCGYAWTALGNITTLLWKSFADFGKKNHLYKWSLFWPWRVCKQAKLLHLGHTQSVPKSDSFWVRRLFKVWVRVFCAPIATILLVYTPAKIKMSFIWKDDFLPKSAYSVSRSQAHLAKRCSSIYIIIVVRRKDETNYLSNQTWAKWYTK